MPDNSAAIVIDIGTTNCKVTCFSCLDATTLGAHKFVTAKQISPQGDVDFDIDALWQEVRQAIAQLNAASPLPVRRISIASFGESGVFLDEHGEILTPMLAWYDRRGEEYLATLSEADSAALAADWRTANGYHLSQPYTVPGRAQRRMVSESGGVVTRSLFSICAIGAARRTRRMGQ